MNIRLLTSRIAVLALTTPLLFITHAWPERSFVDLALPAVGFLLLLVGCTGRIWCAVHIAGRKNSELVVSGPYSICRNPLYLFTLCAFLGVGLSFESLTASAVLALVFFATHWPAIRSEERSLASAFGADFASYAARVPRFVPNLRLFVPAESALISVPAFTRALVEASLIPLSYLGAQGIHAAHEAGLLPSLVAVS